MQITLDCVWFGSAQFGQVIRAKPTQTNFQLFHVNEKEFY